MFYAAPPPVKKLKVNQFLKVDAPPDEFLAKLFSQLKHFSHLLDTQDFSYPAVENNEVIQRVLYLLEKHADKDNINAALKMLLEFEEQVPEHLESAQEMLQCPEGSINIFSELSWPSDYPTLQTKNFSEFSKPLLDSDMTRNIFSSIESLAGEKVQVSTKIASEIINDLGIATLYPPTIQDDISGDDMAQMTKFIVDKMNRVIESSK